MPSQAVEVRIESAAEIAEELRAELERWTDEVFGQIAYQWAPSQWYATARIDGNLVGSLTLVAREAAAAAERVRVGGVGNVVTKPAYRRRGVALAMMRAAEGVMRARLDAEFGLLICRRAVAPVYEKAGWVRVAGPTRFWQPAGITTYPEETMILQLTAREWPGGSIDLCGLPW